MSDLPSGTVTFLLTDVEGSARLWEQCPAPMREAMARHDALVEACVERCGGTVVRPRGEGDSRFAVFARATDSVAAVCALQQVFVAEHWPTLVPVRIRMALHTGEGELREGDYYGPAPNRCARLRGLAHGGQILVSAATAELARDALPEGVSLRSLGMHRLKDLQRPEEVFQLLHPELPADFPALRSLDALPHNLPVQLSSFVGREREMAEVKHLLAKTRLLTLTGAGGCGKTRLALQVAAELLGDYPDGVWLVDLAPLTDPALVPQSVANVLDVREQPGHALTETLQHYLQTKSLLLILDSCEHLIAECAQLASALLSSSPSLRILVTSREALNIVGETTWRVPSLAVPDVQPLPVIEQLVFYEAVQLFVDRASLSQPTFTLSLQNARWVVQVCRQLDGIPLAIELAAMRVKVLTVEQIAERLNDRFRVLTAGSRIALPRHRTLRAAMDWSYDLLSEKERVMLRRLSVFTGGWMLEAAEVVCAKGRIDSSDVLNLLTQLVDKSLVVVEERGGKARYRLLETVRQYAEEKLRESGEEARVRGRHQDFFVAFVERAEPELTGPEQAAWLDRLESDHDNLRTALGDALKAGAEEVALRLSGTLWRFWWYHGHFAEGRRWLEAALASSTALSGPLRAKALVGISSLVRSQGDYGAARIFCEESLVLSRRLEDKKGTALALTALASIVYYQGDYAHAKACYAESLALYREMGDKRGIAVVLSNQGEKALYQGDYEGARVLCEESLALFREIGERRGIAVLLNSLGDVALHQGDCPRATALFAQSLTLYRELVDKESIAECLEGLAEVARTQGRVGRAARLCGAAEALREAIAAPLRPPERASYDRCVALLRTAFGDSAFAASCERGRAMTLEQAIAYALED